MVQDDELRQVALVAERLCARHPAVPRASVEDAVREVHAGFAGSPVRDFVPLLVERGARARIAGLSHARVRRHVS